MISNINNNNLPALITATVIKTILSAATDTVVTISEMAFPPIVDYAAPAPEVPAYMAMVFPVIVAFLLMFVLFLVNYFTEENDDDQDTILAIVPYRGHDRGGRRWTRFFTTIRIQGLELPFETPSFAYRDIRDFPPRPNFLKKFQALMSMAILAKARDSMARSHETAMVLYNQSRAIVPYATRAIVPYASRAIVPYASRAMVLVRQPPHYTFGEELKHLILRAIVLLMNLIRHSTSQVQQGLTMDVRYALPKMSMTMEDLLKVRVPLRWTSFVYETVTCAVVPPVNGLLWTPVIPALPFNLPATRRVGTNYLEFLSMPATSGWMSSCLLAVFMKYVVRRLLAKPTRNAVPVDIDMEAVIDFFFKCIHLMLMLLTLPLVMMTLLLVLVPPFAKSIWVVLLDTLVTMAVELEVTARIFAKHCTNIEVHLCSAVPFFGSL